MAVLGLPRRQAAVLLGERLHLGGVVGLHLRRLALNRSRIPDEEHIVGRQLKNPLRCSAKALVKQSTSTVGPDHYEIHLLVQHVVSYQHLRRAVLDEHSHAGSRFKGKARPIEEFLAALLFEASPMVVKITPAEKRRERRLPAMQ